MTPDLVRHARQLGGVGGPRHPWQLQRVVLVARDHVHVEMEDRLPRGATDVVQDVEAGRVERLAHALGHAPRRLHGGEQVVVVQVSNRFSAWVRVMTTTCPRVAGLMSITVIVRSSESTSSEGISPARTLQKMQFGSRSATRARLPVRASVVYAATPHMPVDNQLYDRLADTWWNDELGAQPAAHQSSTRRASATCGACWSRNLGSTRSGKTALDVGSGGGLLAEEFARLGCPRDRHRPVRASPSRPRARTPRPRASTSSTRSAPASSSRFRDESFDIAYCCDVLEHVDDLDRVLAETSRVLKPGGVYLYDTINRTRRSKLVLIKLMQEWRSTALMEPNLHDWDMFIKPDELGCGDGARRAREPRHRRTRPGAQPDRRLVVDMRRRARGDMTYGEFGARNKFRETRDKSLLYAGHALKRP